MSPALDIREVYRFYRAGDDETLALRGVSLRVEPGEIVGLVGPSGSGKSTLLSCAAGLDDPDGGSVWIAGERLSHRDEQHRCQVRAATVGILFQTANLLEHLSVRGNLKLSQRLAGRRGSDVVDSTISSVGLEHRKHAYPSQLSGGEAARAGLALALVNSPALLLADEPTGELDSTTEAEILSLLRSFADAGGAVLVGSHSPAVAVGADRVVALHDGAVVER